VSVVCGEQRAGEEGRAHRLLTVAAMAGAHIDRLALRLEANSAAETSAFPGHRHRSLFLRTHHALIENGMKADVARSAKGHKGRYRALLLGAPAPSRLRITPANSAQLIRAIPRDAMAQLARRGLSGGGKAIPAPSGWPSDWGGWPE